MSTVPVNASQLVELVKLGVKNNPSAIPPLVEDWANRATEEVARLREMRDSLIEIANGLKQIAEKLQLELTKYAT